MRVFLIFFVAFCLSNIINAKDLSEASVYTLKDCIPPEGGEREDVTINIDKKEIQITMYWNNIIHTFDVQINTIDEEKIVSDLFLTIEYYDNQERKTMDKWAKLAFENTTMQYFIYPKTKKLITVINTPNRTSKDLKKAYKKIWRGYLDNHKDKLNCLSTKIIKTKEKQEPDEESFDSSEIIAASSGSGFFISNYGHVISNFHVVDNCDTITIFSAGRELEADIISSDKINDLTILKVKYNPLSMFSISNEDVSLLEDVIVAGFPLGKNVSAAIKTHKGVVTSLAGAGDNYSNFQTDAAINQGNSGGPIINQMGNVVGVAVASWVEEGVQGVHFGIKSSTLQTFLRSNGLNLQEPSNKDMSNKDLGKLITNATVYIECNMTVAKVKKMLNDSKNRKAFFSNVK